MTLYSHLAIRQLRPHMGKWVHQLPKQATEAALDQVLAVVAYSICVIHLIVFKERTNSSRDYIRLCIIMQTP